MTITTNTSEGLAAPGSATPGVRVLGSRLVAEPSPAADGGRASIQVIGGRDDEEARGLRVLHSGSGTIGARAGIRIIGREEGQ